MKKRSDYRLVVFHFKERELPDFTKEETGAVREAIDYGPTLSLATGLNQVGA